MKTKKRGARMYTKQKQTKQKKNEYVKMINYYSVKYDCLAGSNCARRELVVA